MTEAIVLGAGILIGGLGIAYGLQARQRFHERDEMRRFQEAMRAAGRPSTQKRRK
jgi:predicted RND superfamily exporter protein